MDIDDVQLFDSSTIGNVVIWDGNLLTIRGSLDVSGDIHANNIIAGTINVDRMPISGFPDTGNSILASPGSAQEIGLYSINSSLTSGDWRSAKEVVRVNGPEVDSIIVRYRTRIARSEPTNPPPFLGQDVRSSLVIRLAGSATQYFNLGIVTLNNYDPGSTPRYYRSGNTEIGSNVWAIRTIPIADLGITTPIDLDLMIFARNLDATGGALNDLVVTNTIQSATVRTLSGVTRKASE